VLGTLLPAIFLGVAAFLLNVVVSRLVATQREQIAALKALGYPNRDHRRALPQAGAAHRGLGLAAGHGAGRQAGRHADRAVRRVLPLPALRAPHGALAAGGDRGASRWPPRWPARSTPSWPPCGWRRPRRCARRRRAATGARCSSGWASADAPGAAHDPAQHGAPALAHHAVGRRRGRGGGDRRPGQLLPRRHRHIVDTSSTLAMRSDVAVWTWSSRWTTRRASSWPGCPA
jgi:hypothetical protein